MEKKRDKRLAAQARNEELVVQELPDEVLVYDLKRHTAHCLNTTAAFVWNHCDGQTQADEIAKLMEKEWNTPVSEDMVWFAISRLSKADLLKERIEMPQAQSGMSRRSAVRRLGFGALLAVPAVMSIVSPPAALAASVPPACQQCVKKSNGIGDCPTECTGLVLGTCYDNSGCGSGQALYCASCVSCFSDPTLTGTISWKAPGAKC